MKTNKHFRKLAGVCWLLLALCACEESNESLDHTVKLAVSRGQEPEVVPPASLDALSYTICLFRAAVEGSDRKYHCVTINPGLTKTQANSYSFKISNQDVGIYTYKLFLHATPKEQPETKLYQVEKGSDFEEIAVGMVQQPDQNYVPLTKENYYAIASLLTADLEQGAVTLTLPLKRVVGQLVFDFFKSKEDGSPVDIPQEFLSTLDRVNRIVTEVEGMSTQIKIAGMVGLERKGTITKEIIPTLEDDKRLDASKQDAKFITPIDPEKLIPRGGTRVFSTFLLPTDKNETLKVKLTLSYHDTPFVDEIKTVELNLPTSGKALKVLENCYTLTNIRLKQNRVIDLTTSGGIDIDTGWDENRITP